MPKHDDPPPAEPTVTLTQAQFAELLAAKSGGLTEAGLERILAAVVDATVKAVPRDAKEGNLSREQIAALRLPPPEREWVERWLWNQDTGATCLMRCVVERDADGVRREIACTPLRYVWPRGYLRYKKDGGLVPDGVAITDSPAGEVALAAGGKTIAELLTAQVFSEAVARLMRVAWTHDMSEHGWKRPGGLLPHHYAPDPPEPPADVPAT